MGALRYLLVIALVGTLSLLTVAEHAERTRLGFRYFSETSPELSGPIRGPRRDAVVSTEIVFPTILTGDVYHELNDTWAVMATVRWEQWSAFDQQFLLSRGSDERRFAGGFLRSDDGRRASTERDALSACCGFQHF